MLWNTTWTPSEPFVGRFGASSTHRIEGTSMDEIILHVKTDDGKTMMIHVGPRSYVDRQNISFREGDAVTVTGSLIKTGQHEAHCGFADSEGRQDPQSAGPKRKTPVESGAVRESECSQKLWSDAELLLVLRLSVNAKVGSSAGDGRCGEPNEGRGTGPISMHFYHGGRATGRAFARCGALGALIPVWSQSRFTDCSKADCTGSMAGVDHGTSDYSLRSIVCG